MLSNSDVNGMSYESQSSVHIISFDVLYEGGFLVKEYAALVFPLPLSVAAALSLARFQAVYHSPRLLLLTQTKPAVIPTTSAAAAAVISYTLPPSPPPAIRVTAC